MSYQEILEKIKPNFENVVDLFKGELQKIRANRVSAALIEDIKVDCFGSILPLKQLGAISIPSLREISIQLWDKSYVDSVVRAIEKENLGLGIRVEENKIYLSAPPLTEETRKNLIRVLNQKKEETFQEIRRIRDKAWKEIQEGFQKGEIREDDKYRGKDKLEEIVHEYREKIEEIAENKEKEIMG
jgi:ribosome recycling factor